MERDREEEEAFNLFETGNFVAAREKFERLHGSAATDSARESHRLNQANCLVAEGDHEKALEILSGLCCPVDDIWIIYSKTLCLIGLKDYDSAIEQLARFSPATITGPHDDDDDHHDHDHLLASILDLMSICVNSNHAWKSHHTNCLLIESLLLKLREPIGDRLDEGQYLWQRNMAHIMFMMDTRYEDCAQAYNELMLEPQQGRGSGHDGSAPVAANGEVESSSFTGVEPVVLRNLCVSYILTGRNRDAEQLIKEVELDEQEEAAAAAAADSGELSSILYGTVANSRAVAGLAPSSTEQPDEEQLQSHGTATTQLLHINLAIGTLYCVKNNYEFGMARIIETLEPLDKKLTTFAWQQARRCILSLLDKHCRQLIYIKDDLFDEIVRFLIRCEPSGLLVPAASVSGGSQAAALQPIDGKNSVTYEARYLRAILLRVIHD